MNNNMNNKIDPMMMYVLAEDYLESNVRPYSKAFGSYSLNIADTFMYLAEQPKLKELGYQCAGVFNAPGSGKPDFVMAEGLIIAQSIMRYEGEETIDSSVSLNGLTLRKDKCIMHRFMQVTNVESEEIFPAFNPDGTILIPFNGEAIVQDAFEVGKKDPRIAIDKAYKDLHGKTNPDSDYYKWYVSLTADKQKGKGTRQRQRLYKQYMQQVVKAVKELGYGNCPAEALQVAVMGAYSKAYTVIDQDYIHKMLKIVVPVFSVWVRYAPDSAYKVKGKVKLFGTNRFEMKGVLKLDIYNALKEKGVSAAVIRYAEINNQLPDLLKEHDITTDSEGKVVTAQAEAQTPLSVADYAKLLKKHEDNMSIAFSRKSKLWANLNVLQKAWVVLYCCSIAIDDKDVQKAFKRQYALANYTAANLGLIDTESYFGLPKTIVVNSCKKIMPRIAGIIEEAYNVGPNYVQEWYGKFFAAAVKSTTAVETTTVTKTPVVEQPKVEQPQATPEPTPKVVEESTQIDEPTSDVVVTPEQVEAPKVELDLFGSLENAGLVTSIATNDTVELNLGESKEEPEDVYEDVYGDEHYLDDEVSEEEIESQVSTEAEEKLTTTVVGNGRPEGFLQNLKGMNLKPMKAVDNE